MPLPDPFQIRILVLGWTEESLASAQQNPYGIRLKENWAGNTKFAVLRARFAADKFDRSALFKGGETMANLVNEEQLVAAAHAGDQDAVPSHIASRYRSTLQITAGKTPNRKDAEDAVREAMLKADCNFE